MTPADFPEPDLLPAKKKKAQRKANSAPSGPCETCLYYDVLDESGAEGCTVDVDEDEACRERSDPRQTCPYYRYYDEYKTVRKQN